jgi:hypothetical protein
VPLDDFLADRKPNPCAGVFRPGVQALEDLEDAVGIAGVDSDAVILDGKQPVRTSIGGGDVNSKGGWSAELDGVANEVLEQLA